MHLFVVCLSRQFDFGQANAAVTQDLPMPHFAPNLYVALSNNGGLIMLTITQ